MHAIQLSAAHPEDRALRESIERFAADFGGLSARLAQNRLAEMRSAAGQLGFTPLVTLIRRFEEAVAEGAYRIAGGPLIAAMRDAAELGRAEANVGQAYLAHVNSRLIG